MTYMAPTRPPISDRILFVSATGNDSADGLARDTPKLTIGAALVALGGPGTVYVGSGSFDLGAGIGLTAQQRLIGNGRRSTRLGYRGNGVAIGNLTPAAVAHTVHLEGFQLDLSLAGSGAVGIEARNMYWPVVSEVEVTLGATATTGVLIPTGGSPYWGHWYDVIVSSSAPVHASSVGVRLEAGGNAHSFFGLTIHNCATGLSVTGGTNSFYGMASNDCTVNHFDIDGRWNQFIGYRIESGAPGGAAILRASGLWNQFIGGTISGTVTVTDLAAKVTTWIGLSAVNKTVTGSRASGAALASLLARLSDAGLIIDQTVA